MRFIVISLGIIAAVMISSSHALGGDALDIAGKGKDGVGKVTDALDVNETDGNLPGSNEAKEIVDKAKEVASDAKGAVSEVKDGVSEAGSGASEAKAASSVSKADIGNKARARRSFLVRKNLGHAVYKRRIASDKSSHGDSKHRHDDDDDEDDEDDEDEDENNKNKSREDYRDSITRRGSV